MEGCPAKKFCLKSGPLEDMSLPQQTRNLDVPDDFEIINRSAIESPTNDLAGRKILSPSGSKTRIEDLQKDVIGDLTTTMSDTLQLPVSPPRKDTPIPATYSHSGITSVNVVCLDTPSPFVTQTHPAQAAAEAGTVDPVLGEAYTTVLESGHRPIGHRSSPSLRHIVFSSRTNPTSSVYPPNEGQEDVNSSTESFVKVTPPHGSPDLTIGGAVSFSSYDEGANLRQRTIHQPAPYNRSEPMAVLEDEHLTVSRGGNTHRQAVAYALPDVSPRATASNDVSPPESSAFVQGTLPAIPSPSLLYLINLPSAASSATASSDDLARSYNSAEDPNNLKYWWEAGIRDGDPVGSPLSRHSPSTRRSSHVLGDEYRGISPQSSMDQVTGMSSSQATSQARGDDCVGQLNPTVLHPSPEERWPKQHTGKQLLKSDSDESVEQGRRELQSSLSDDALFKGRAIIENALLEIVDEKADEARAKADGPDVPGEQMPWLKPLDMLLQEAPELDLDVSIRPLASVDMSLNFYSCTGYRVRIYRLLQHLIFTSRTKQDRLDPYRLLYPIAKASVFCLPRSKRIGRRHLQMQHRSTLLIYTSP